MSDAYEPGLRRALEGIDVALCGFHAPKFALFHALIGRMQDELHAEMIRAVRSAVEHDKWCEGDPAMMEWAAYNLEDAAGKLAEQLRANAAYDQEAAE
jgi:hypothetical protein